LVKPLAEKGFNVFIIDYSGFGISTGKSTRKNVMIDAQAALDFFLQQDECKGKKVLIYGQSLGGHLAVNLAQRNEAKIDGLIAEGAFTNHDEIAAHVSHLGFLAKMLIIEHYDGLKAIKKFKKPVLIIHSNEDKEVPYFMGEKLYKYANEPKEFYPIDNCHICGPIYYIDSISAKIERMVGEK
jgi:fermentation-respiration switch protein FrsA (DUF1100 family)